MSHQNRHGPTHKKNSEEGERLFKALCKAFPNQWCHADYIPSGDHKPSSLILQLGEGYDWTRYEKMRVRRDKITDEWAEALVAKFKEMIKL